MCRAAGIAAAIVMTWIAPQAAQAATCEYVGAAGGAWENALNWKSCGVPGSDDAVELGTGDDVLISTADAVAGTLSLSGGARLGFANAHVLAVSGSSALQSGTVTGDGRLDAAGGFAKTTAGQLILAGGVTVAAGTTSTSTWTAGDVCLTGGSTL